jgi:hypothetical protein
MKGFCWSFFLLLALQGHAQLSLDSATRMLLLKSVPDTVYRSYSLRLYAAPKDTAGSGSHQVPVQELLLRTLHRRRIFPTADALAVLVEDNPELKSRDSVPRSYRLVVPPLPRLSRPARRLRRAEYRYYIRPDTALSHDFTLLAGQFIFLHDTVPKIPMAAAFDSLRTVLWTGRFTTEKVNRLQLTLMNEVLAGLDHSLESMRRNSVMDSARTDSLAHMAEFICRFFTLKDSVSGHRGIVRRGRRGGLTEAAADVEADPADGPPPSTGPQYVARDLHMYRVNFYVSEGNGDFVPGGYHIWYRAQPNQDYTKTQELASTGGAIMLRGCYYFQVLDRPDQIPKNFVTLSQRPIDVNAEEESGWRYRFWKLFTGEPVYSLTFRVLPGPIPNPLPK